MRAKGEDSANGGTFPPKRAGVRLFRSGRLFRNADEKGDVAVAGKFCRLDYFINTTHRNLSIGPLKLRNDNQHTQQCSPITYVIHNVT